ncbi:MAG: potassium transporter TrkH [Planctomycetes bacterium]|nr:potassium transporter TrkH [Planctomycetota bacterium]
MNTESERSEQVARSPRRPFSTSSGALLAATPIPFAVTAWAHGGVDLGTPIWALVLLTASTISLAVAGLTISTHARPGRVLATLGTIAPVVLATPHLSKSPGFALLLAVSSLVSVAIIWRYAAALFSGSLQRSHPGLGRVRGSAAVAIMFWLVVGISGEHVGFAICASVGVSMLVAITIGVVWLIQRRHSTNPRTRTLTAALLATFALGAAAHEDPWSLVSSAAVYALIATVFGPRTERPGLGEGRWWSTLIEHPERMLVSTFVTMAAIGAVVLALPQSSADGASIGGLDAAFTSISAVCVTGLIVCDTPVDFTFLGQVALLVLIQLGGLGIMTFSTAALRVLGGRMSLKQESAVAHLIGARDRSRLVASAQDVLRVTFVVEGVGAVVLASLFLLHGESFGAACWQGCFTAVSAFCNAGFALHSDSLIPYQEAPLVLHVVAALIVIGGLSPAVVLALTTRRDPFRPTAIHIKICLLSAIVLLVTGFVLFLMWEWDRSLIGLSVMDKIHNAWFQSVTLRTAGFNSVDVAAVHPATYVLMLGMMFVGASPGGTAGGIKTTTAVVLLLSVVHTIRGSTSVSVFGRRISERTVQRASVIVTVATLGALVAVIALLLTQRIPLPAALFEVVSALGTVGLSQGATSQLDDVGKVIILLCMFVGRIGGLSIMMFMSQRGSTGGIVLPTEDVDVG